MVAVTFDNDNGSDHNCADDDCHADGAGDDDDDADDDDDDDDEEEEEEEDGTNEKDGDGADEDDDDGDGDDDDDDDDDAHDCSDGGDEEMMISTAVHDTGNEGCLQVQVSAKLWSANRPVGILHRSFGL